MPGHMSIVSLWQLMRHRLSTVTDDFNGALTLARLSDIVGHLHPHKRIHLDAERLLDAQRHLARQISLAIQETGQGSDETRPAPSPRP